MTSTVWNSADKDSAITLSSGNLVATCNTSGRAGVRGTTSKDSTLGGKFVISFDAVSYNSSGSPDNFDWVGLRLATDPLHDANGSFKQVILYENGSSSSGDGSGSHEFSDFSAITTSSTIDLAIDFDNMKFWFRVNGGTWQNSGNPATNSGGRSINASGVYYPSARVTDSPHTATINPIPTGLPSGFQPWDVAVPATWNPSDKTSNITLSGSDLIATCTSGATGGVRGTTSKNSAALGKFMIGFRNVTLSDIFDWVGVMESSQTLGTANGNLIEVILTQEGKTYSGDGGTSDQNFDFAALTGTHDYDLALDFDNLKFWYRKDGGAWQNSGNPATNTGGRNILADGIFYPGFRITGTSNAATLEPRPSGLPSGFSAWDDTGAGNANGANLTVTTSLIYSGAFVPGSLRTITTAIIIPDGFATGALITVTTSIHIPGPVLSVSFDDGSLFDAWSEIFNSNVVQCTVISIGR